jgi:simple sugar transport system ATP-binding protein
MLLLREREKGTAILLISTDLQEVLSLSDRVLVIYEGKEMGTLTTSEVDVEQLGLMMAGISFIPQMGTMHG